MKRESIASAVGRFGFVHRMAYPPPLWVRALADREKIRVARECGVDVVNILAPYRTRRAKRLLATRLHDVFPYPCLLARAVGVGENTFRHWLRTGRAA